VDKIKMRTIDWDEKTDSVKLIDQTLLPAEYEILECKTLEQLIDAIQRLKVRGAPALGEAQRIADEDVAVNKKIGDYGSELLEDGDVVLTHCNAGRLACVDWGTALGVIRTAIEKGKRIEVIACETRPLNQGSRITAWELLQDKIPVTLITDSMGAAVMREGKVDKVIVGADRVVKEGVINKIGTYMHAVVAKEHKIPFYVAAPLSSFDIKRSYKEVEIEERSPEELIFFSGKQIAPLDVKVYNPAFDFTPFELIAAVITEEGVYRHSTQ
jgi:methylthioribose-1-phosphate isomerase